MVFHPRVRLGLRTRHELIDYARTGLAPIMTRSAGAARMSGVFCAIAQLNRTHATRIATGIAFRLRLGPVQAS